MTTHDDLKKRLDRIEQKLDRHLEIVTKSKTDITWIQGYIRVSVTMLITVIAGMVGILIDKFK